MNYTPGPWDYRDVCPSNGFMVYRFNNFSGSFQQWAQDGTKAGNARLVVKAPEMYELIEKMWEIYNSYPALAEDEVTYDKIHKLIKEFEK